MGLAERRAVKGFQENKFPKLQQEVHQAAGFPVELDIRWDTLGVDDYAEMYEDAFVKVYFKPLIEALRAVACDDLGREALKEGLKKVVIRHTGTADIAFSGGVLTFDHHPVSNLDYWSDRKATLQKALEKGL